MLTIVKFILQGLCRGVSKAADCDRTGKYPNDELPNCRGFTTCTPIGMSNFYKYNLPCPETFIFNHFDNQCSNATGYRCFTDYNCTTIGNFEYLGSENCTSYLACVQGLTNVVTARLIDCTLDKVFNPDVGYCVARAEYTCPHGIISTTTSTVDIGTEMFFIYNNNISVTEVFEQEGAVTVYSSSAILHVNFGILLLPLLIAYFVGLKAL